MQSSVSEGSPQFIKESMACNRPIVCTDVGDVKGIIKNIDGCFICRSNPIDVKEKIIQAMRFDETDARKIIMTLSNDLIAPRIVEIYRSVVLAP